MNYNLISQLVANGMNGEEIIPLLIRNAPHLASKIKKLVVGGWGPNEVLLALQKDPEMGKVSLKNGKPSTPEEIAALKVYQGRRSPDKSRDEQALAQLRSFTGNALKAGAAVGGAYLGGRALQAGVGALQGMMGGGGQPPGPQPTIPPQHPQMLPSSPISTNPSPASPNPSPAPEIGQAIQAQAQAPVAQAMQPQTQQMVPPPQAATPQVDIEGILEQSGLKNMVDALRVNNPPELLASIVKTKLGKNAQAIEQAAQMPVEQLVEEYLKATPPPPSLKEKIPFGEKVRGEPGYQDRNIQEPELPINENIEPEKTIKNPRVLDIGISKAGKIGPVTEKTVNAVYGQGKPEKISGFRRLSDITYEDKYKNLTPQEKDTFKIIDTAIDKTAKHLVSGKSFADLLPIKEHGIQLSTAEDVLRALAGVPSKYNLMTDEEREDVFSTFQGITPNVVWNTISLIDPRIQKIKRPNPSPKGAKAGKTEMSPNDFRRFLAHSVTKMMERHQDFGPRAKMITSVVDMIDKFEMRKSKSDIFPDLQNLSDEELFALLDSVPEEEVKKYR